MKKIDRQIQEQAAMQYGLVTRSQLLEHGKRGQITRRLESGMLVRVRQSVYRAPSLPVTWRQELLSACFAGGRLSAASFRAAAQITFLPGGQEIVEISCRRHRRAQYDDVIVHETRFLEDRDIIIIDGIPVTRAARTICDLACLVELGELEEATLRLALLEAVRRNLVDIPLVWKEHERMGGTFRLGGTAMLKALERFVPPIRPTESTGESKVLQTLRDNDFPDPVPQFWITFPDGERIRLDNAWPQWKAALEFDPYKWHGDRDRYEAMMSRTRRMRAIGWERISVTDDDLDNGMPEALAALAQVVPRRQQGPENGPC